MRASISVVFMMAAAELQGRIRALIESGTERPKAAYWLKDSSAQLDVAVNCLELAFISEGPEA